MLLGTAEVMLYELLTFVIEVYISEAADRMDRFVLFCGSEACWARTWCYLFVHDMCSVCAWH